MPRTSALLFFILCCGVLLVVRCSVVFLAPEPPLAARTGAMAVLAGAVSDDPDQRAASLRVTLDVTHVNGERAEGRALVVLPRDTKLSFGDRLEARGMLEEPEAFLTDTGREFDYKRYLRARGVHMLMQNAELRSHKTGPLSVRKALFALKHSLERALETVMREPHVSLMEGLLLGERGGLSSSLTQAFVLTGLIHIVVLSGYNIGVVSEWTLRLFEWVLPRRTALAGAGIVLVLFALMAGGGMATLRAMLMGVIALVARYLRRPQAALRALVCAAAVMLAWNPLVLFDTGFILSITATFGLITLSPAVEAKLAFLKPAGVRAAAATTIAVQMFVLPALLYITGVLSFVSLPANIVVLPLVPLAMCMGFVAGTLALVHPYLGLVPGFMSDMLLGGILSFTTWSAALPHAAVVVPPFPVWVALAAYVPLTLVALRLYRSGSPSPTS